MRAYIVLGRLEAQQGNLEASAQAFERVAVLDADYVPEILPPLLDCYARLGQMGRAEKFLLDITERSQGVSPVIALSKLYASTRGEEAAIEFMTRQLRQRPSVRGLMALISASLDNSRGEARENLLILQDLTRKLVEGQAMYRCNKCGFGAKAHHWQCPSCKTGVRCGRSTASSANSPRALNCAASFVEFSMTGFASLAASDVAMWLAAVAALSALLTACAMLYARRRLVDLPGQRRSHTAPTPRGGGIGMCIAGVIGLVELSIFVADVAPPVRLIAAIALVAVIGWIDDHRPLPILARLIPQIAAVVMFLLADRGADRG